MQYESNKDYFARCGKDMSEHQRPSAVRQDTINPALREENTSIPVTPGITSAAYTDPNPYSDAFGRVNEQHASTSGANGPPWNANITGAGGPPNGRRPSSPTEVAKGARNGEDLLRRFSLNGQGSKYPDLADLDPRAAHKNLNLSGHVISATFCVPYKIGYTPGAEWASDNPPSIRYAQH